MENKQSSNDIFNLLMMDIKTDNLSRYAHSNRDETLENLMNMFYDAKVDIEDARSYRRKVVEIMTTEEGRKGKGKYKGWTQAVEESFDCMLAKTYVKITPRAKGNPSEAKNNGPTLMPGQMPVVIIKNGNDRYITAWAKNRFGDTWTEEINILAHTVGHSLNLKFMKDMFEDSEILKGNYPTWLKNA
jgi:hypothetical protein